LLDSRNAEEHTPADLTPTGGYNVTETKVTAPKQGDHVSSATQEGAFEIVFVNSLMQSANIRLLDGTGHVVPNVPWTELKPLKK
jgi:hypothetical protein